MGPKEREIKRRLRVLEHAKKIGNVRMTCSYFGLSRSTFYRWKTKYDKQGESGLGNKSTAARNHPRKVQAEIVAKIVHLRRKIHTKRYQKQVPGHHIQVDVKFLKFLDKNKKSIKRY
jgi:transposase